MSTKQTEILFICGSPRSHASEALLALLEQGAREAGARSRKFLLSKKHIAPCTGCGYCEKTGTCILVDERAESNQSDDYLELLDAMSYADALAVVSPLYFAGPPAQLKALYDRMQPFWSRKYLLDQKQQTKRPAQIFILGGGGDAHGYEPLVTISRSALAVAGFSIEKVQNFVGFKHVKDVAALPTEEEAANMAFGELAHLRKAAALQREFEQRALAAGSAFARFVSKSLLKDELQAELKAVETELADLQSDDLSLSADKPHNNDLSSSDTSADNKASGDSTSSFEKSQSWTSAGSGESSGESGEFGRSTVEVVNHLDSGFEALKRSARTAKSSKAEKAAAEAKADAVAESEAKVEARAEADKEQEAPSQEDAEESSAGSIHDIEPASDSSDKDATS